ncbi:MAG: MFS transporter [Chthoniobacterales bacterium]
MNPLRLLPAYFVVFDGFVGYSMMVAIFAPMCLNGYGTLVPATMSIAAKSLLLGVVLCMYPLGQFLSSPVIGALSDKYGRRPLLIVSLALSVLSYAGVAAAIQFQKLPLMIIMLVAAGLTEGNIVIAQSTISDISDATNRGRYFGYINLSGALAFVVGPLVGGKLASPSVVSWFTYATPFWVMLIPLSLTLAGVIAFFPETLKPGSTAPICWSKALTNLSAVFHPGPLRVIYIGNFACYLGIFGFFRCYPMFLVDEFHMTVSRVSLYIAWEAVPVIIGTMGLTGYLMSKYSAQKITIWSAVMTAVAMFIIVLPKSPYYLWGTLFLVGLPLSVCLTACATMLSVAASAEEQGSVMGNNQALQVFAEASSSIIGGAIAAILITASIPSMGFFLLIGAAILLLAKKSS